MEQISNGNYHLEKLKSSLGKYTDAEEVISDVRMHVETELLAANMSVVIEGDLKRILKRIGLPENSEQGNVQGNPSDTSVDGNWLNDAFAFKINETVNLPAFRPVLITIFGIIFPLGAVAVELFTGMCSAIFFDPIPSFFASDSFSVYTIV